ncbi:MAG: hypothetical protein AB1758_14385 [Candidatus Eremiobacterota bacterium]
MGFQWPAGLDHMARLQAECQTAELALSHEEAQELRWDRLSRLMESFSQLSEDPEDAGSFDPRVGLAMA